MYYTVVSIMSSNVTNYAAIFSQIFKTNTLLPRQSLSCSAEYEHIQRGLVRGSEWASGSVWPAAFIQGLPAVVEERRLVEGDPAAALGARGQEALRLHVHVGAGGRQAVWLVDPDGDLCWGRVGCIEGEVKVWWKNSTTASFTTVLSCKCIYV